MEMWTWVEYRIICKWELRRLLSFIKLMETCELSGNFYALEIHHFTISRLSTRATLIYFQNFLCIPLEKIELSNLCFKNCSKFERKQIPRSYSAKKKTNFAAFIQFRDFFVAMLLVDSSITLGNFLSEFLVVELKRRHDK